MFGKMNGLEKLLWVLGILSLPVAVGLFLLAAARIVFHLRTISEELQFARQRSIAAEAKSPSAKEELRNDFAARRPERSTGGVVIQTPSPSGPKATVWNCKKCGVTNPMSSNTCKGCAAYR